jgi:hypothetical protein
LALNAGRAADLPVELDVSTTTGVTPVSFAIVGGAGDDLWRGRTWWRTVPTTAYSKVGAASAVDPEATVVEPPGLALNTRGAADLTDQPDIAAVVWRTSFCVRR